MQKLFGMFQSGAAQCTGSRTPCQGQKEFPGGAAGKLTLGEAKALVSAPLCSRLGRGELCWRRAFARSGSDWLRLHNDPLMMPGIEKLTNSGLVSRTESSSLPVPVCCKTQIAVDSPNGI